MLEIHKIKINKLAVIQGLQKRKFPKAGAEIQTVLDLDERRRTTQNELDKTLFEANQAAKSIGKLIREGKNQSAESAKSRSKELKNISKQLQERLNGIQEEMRQTLLNLPNIPHPDVPEGTSDADNEIIESNNLKVDLGADKLPHWDLAKNFDIIDFELGNKITGSGFPVYKKHGARLQRALINYFLDEAAKAGYSEVQPPVIVNEASGYATGQLPDKEGQMYGLAEGQFYLIPTAEVPITNMYRDAILKPEDLPKKIVGYTPCFRREAGSWGAHVRGLNRLHQFDKVEIVQITQPEFSYEVLEEMCQYVKSLLKKLELPYRMVRLCSGDLGFTSAMTYDFEVFSAAQEKWLEVSSVSNFESYQANRLKLRYKSGGEKNELLHTLNGSALALPRIVAAILENGQKNGCIHIPKVIEPYAGFATIQ